MTLSARRGYLVMANALGQTVRSFGRFIRTPWFAAAVPILTLIYGVGDHYGFWDYARGRTAIIRSLDRLASGEGYPFHLFSNPIRTSTLSIALSNRGRQIVTFQRRCLPVDDR